MRKECLQNLETNMKNVLLLMGGGGSEHEISLLSAKYIKDQIDSTQFRVLSVEIDKKFKWKFENLLCSLDFERTLKTSNGDFKVDMAIPCIHGFPGETGDIQSYFELIGLPYLGCNSETSVLCFNKLSTKLWLEKSGINTTPFIQINDTSSKELINANAFLDQHSVVYVKATNQGSSVGCYRCDNQKDLEKAVTEAFKFSPFVILEKEIVGREIEVSAFEFNNEIHITVPGEIECPGQFYSYEEKYAGNSHTKTHVVAPNITEEINMEIKRQALAAFKILKLRHLSRIDFFLTKDNAVIINEINTFPGHTSISMFPTMMENYGVKYSEFLNKALSSLS
jgi:D-alanine-D-alanine ligase